MLRIAPISIAILFATMLVAVAAERDLILGTWKMDLAKSTGLAVRSATLTYVQDGEWIVVKDERVGTDGTLTSPMNRYKRDGKEYPWRNRYGNSGTVTVKAIDAYTIETTIKVGNAIKHSRTSISSDEKSLTRTATGSNARGPVNTVAVYQKQ
jgi:hypothetical protein